MRPKPLAMASVSERNEAKYCEPPRTAVIATAHTKPAGIPTLISANSCSSPAGAKGDRVIDSVTADQRHDQFRTTVEPHQGDDRLPTVRLPEVGVCRRGVDPPSLRLRCAWRRHQQHQQTSYDDSSHLGHPFRPVTIRLRVDCVLSRLCHLRHNALPQFVALRSFVNHGSALTVKLD